MPNSPTTAMPRKNGSAPWLLCVVGGLALSGCFGGPTADFPFERKGGSENEGVSSPDDNGGNAGGGNAGGETDSSADAGTLPEAPPTSGVGDSDCPRDHLEDRDASAPAQAGDGGTPNADAGTPDPQVSDAGSLPSCDGGQPETLDQNLTVGSAPCESGAAKRGRLEQQLGHEPADPCACRETDEHDAE